MELWGPGFILNSTRFSPFPMPLASTRRTFLKSSAALPLLAASTRAADVLVPRPDRASPLSPPNEKIQTARQAALSLLKPSARDLEHGMRLHAESLVCEPYGFAPQCAVDGDAFRAVVQAGATDAELLDLVEEMRMTRAATDAQQRAEFFEAFRASGITCIYQNAGEEGNDPLRLMKRLARFTLTTDMLRGELFKAVRPDDMLQAKRENKLCLAFVTNGVPLQQHWENTRDESRFIRLFFQLGVRTMHLTYNRRNPLGDGAGEPANAGLSDFGRIVIKEMNRVGVVVDVAHSGYQTSIDAAKASGKPIIASHTTCGGLNPHIRSKPDEVLKAVCDSGGFFGICVIPRFLGGTADIQMLLNHLDYGIRKFGAEHLAIATDVAYRSSREESERAKVPARASGVSPLALPASRWEHLWPPDEFAVRGTPQGLLSTAWTNWPLFTVGLVQRGHSDDVIRKVLGENALRVARAAFPAIPV